MTDTPNAPTAMMPAEMSQVGRTVDTGSTRTADAHSGRREAPGTVRTPDREPRGTTTERSDHGRGPRAALTTP